MKKPGKVLIIIDSIINLVLGIILLAYSEPIINFFGLPETSLNFYPNILGAILFGIGIALCTEYKREDTFIGLGLGGAISINMMGGMVSVSMACHWKSKYTCSRNNHIMDTGYNIVKYEHFRIGGVFEK
jgi:hypothetical protein